MNRFDLTRKIRTDKLLAATPVILVTSLDSGKTANREWMPVRMHIL
ncbi:MAG: hypothetical protein R2875_18820 [Desulfobacterales bacterium]